MRKRTTRIIALTLVLIFVFQVIPMTSFAEADGMNITSEPEDVIAQLADEFPQDVEPSAIVCEDTGARTENEKQFLMEDGSYLLAQYPTAVHYENENGEWTDIDNTLVYEESANASDFDGYTNTENSFSVKFAEDAEEQLFRFNEEDYSIGMGLIDDELINSEIVVTDDETIIPTDADSVDVQNEQKMTLDNLTAEVMYNNILPDTSIEYTVFPDGVKEYIIINSKQDSYEYSFELSLGNLSLCENTDGSISIMTTDTSTPEEKYIIPAPYMVVDANGETSYDVVYRVSTGIDGSYILTVEANEEWINDADTVLPVKIDPSVIKSYSIATFQDTFIASATIYENTNFSNSSSIIIGANNTYGNAYGCYKVNFTSVPDGCEVIKSAKLHLNILNSNVTGNGIALECRRAVESWIDTSITWNNQPDIDNTSIDYVVVDVDSDSFDVNITKAFANDFYNGTNYGFVIKAADNTVGNSFVSVGTVESTDNKPTVEIVFNKQKGLDSVQSYIPVECGANGTLYINTYNGDLTYLHKSFVSSNGKIHIDSIYNQYMIDTDMTYENTVYSPEGILVGDYWKMSAYETIIPISESEYISQGLSVSTSQDDYGYAYLYNDMYGTNIYLIASETNGLTYTFVDQYGRDYALTVTREYDNGMLKDTGYSLLTPDGTYKTFKIIDINNGTRQKGYILTSRNDNVTLTYTYDLEFTTQLNSIKANGDRSPVNFTYNAVGDDENSDGYLSSIGPGNSTAVTFSYANLQNNDTKLSSITNISEGTSTFSYDSNNKLINVFETDGAQLSIDYTNYGRLSRVTWKKTPSSMPVITDFTYNLGTTVVHYYGDDGISATEDDITIKYVFNDAGKNIGAFAMTADGKIHERSINTVYESFEDIAAVNSSEAYAYYMENEVSAAGQNNAYASSIKRTSEEHFRGNSCYELSTVWKYLGKNISLESGVHTFSAYVKCTEGITKTVNGELTYTPITISASDYWGEILECGTFENETVTSENISQHIGVETGSSSKITPQRIYMTNASDNNGWQKITCTINVEWDSDNEYGFPTDAPAKIDLNIDARGAGTIYIDEITLDGQLLSWESDDNTVIASGFESYVSPDIYWAKENCPYKRVTSDANNVLFPEDAYDDSEYDTENTLFGEFSLKIEGDLNDDDKALYHTEYLNTTDVSEYAFSLSGWGKADSLPISGPDAPQGFELFAYYIYYVRSADGTREMRTVSTALPFNWQVDGWQYVSKNLNLPEVGEGETITNVYSVTFGLLYKGNLNTAYFDNVELAYVDSN